MALEIFTGPDVVNDKVIAVGDAFGGSTVPEITMSGESLNNKGPVAFQVTLANGNMLVVRAEPKALGN